MIKGISLLFIIAIASASCQIDDKTAGQVALGHFFDNAQQVIPKGLSGVPAGADVDNYVVAYCKGLTQEELSEAIVAVAAGKSSACVTAVEQYAFATQARNLNMDCIMFSLPQWKESHPIQRIIKSGFPLGRLLKMTPEGWRMYQERIFERFFTVAQACQ